MISGMDTKELAPESPGTSFLDVWNRADPRSVVNLVPPVVADWMFKAAEAKPELFQIDERTLYKRLRDDNRTPTPTDNRLRLKFWDEYDRVQAEVAKRMVITNITPGVCADSYFTDCYIRNTEKVAWLLCPPASYKVKMEEALAFGIEQLRDMLELPHVSQFGKVDVKLMELKAKIVAMMDIRVTGAITQKIEQKSMSISVQTSDRTVANKALQGSMEDIERRLKELRRRDRVAGAQEIEVKAEIEK